MYFFFSQNIKFTYVNYDGLRVNYLLAIITILTIMLELLFLFDL